MAEWAATGWRGRVVLQYTLILPAGIHATLLRRGMNKPWSYRIGWDEDRTGAYKHRWAAQRACESRLLTECRKACRAISGKPRVRL